MCAKSHTRLADLGILGLPARCFRPVTEAPQDVHGLACRGEQHEVLCQPGGLFLGRSSVVRASPWTVNRRAATSTASRLTVVRQVVLQGDKLSLTGGFGQSSVLSCTALTHGLFCRGESGRRQVTVIVNGNMLLESIADATSQRESVGLSYVCDRSVELAAR